MKFQRERDTGIGMRRIGRGRPVGLVPALEPSRPDERRVNCRVRWPAMPPPPSRLHADAGEPLVRLGQGDCERQLTPAEANAAAICLMWVAIAVIVFLACLGLLLV